MFQNERNRNVIIAGLLVLLAAYTRLISHPFNMTAIGALALFSGARMGNRYLSYLVPVSALLVSDLIIGLHPTMFPVYACFLLTVAVGRRLSAETNALKIAASSVFCSTVFYLVTNLPFFYPGMYSFDLQGALQSYTAALPFYRNQLLGDLFYTGLLFGLYRFAVRIPALLVR
ncbi:MAG: hypothetical protein RL213_766 [Bacteroidota bacterium]|jgi:hypothetical protein